VRSAIGWPDFRLAGRTGRAAPFGDVLTAAPRCLDHLVVGSRPRVDEPVAKGDCGVVDDFGDLEGTQVAKTTVAAQHT
jgi:hypothetical protein